MFERHEATDPSDGAWAKYALANGPFVNPLAVRMDFWAGWHARDEEAQRWVDREVGLRDELAAERAITTALLERVTVLEAQRRTES